MTPEELISDFDENFDLDNFEVSHNRFINNKVKDYILSKLSLQAQEYEKKFEECLPKEKLDLDLQPGFNITAEYRLGQLRGGNEAINEIRSNWKGIK